AGGDGPIPFRCGPSIGTLRQASWELTRLYLRPSVAAGHPSTKGDGLERRLLHAAEAGDAVAQCKLRIPYANGLDDNGHAAEARRFARDWTPRRPKQAVDLASPKS